MGRPPAGRGLGLCGIPPASLATPKPRESGGEAGLEALAPFFFLGGGVGLTVVSGRWGLGKEDMQRVCVCVCVCVLFFLGGGWWRRYGIG